MHKLFTVFIILLTLAAALVIGILITDYITTHSAGSTPLSFSVVHEQKPEQQQPTEFDEAVFTIDEGMRLDYASNPMVIDYEGMSVTLAYEDRAKDLKSAPSTTAPVAYSEDGLSFTATEQERYTITSRPVQVSDGTYRRFSYDPAKGGLLGQISEDGITYTDQETIAFSTESEGTNDPDIFGVYTYFVDAQGGIVLLFNRTDEDGAIVVDRAYASPEDNWGTFVLEEQDILDGTLSSELYADPNAIVLENGDVWLIVMNQDKDRPMPPLGRQGSIHAYVSKDGGKTFDYWGHLFSYDDVTEFDVYSLNDPKIVEHSDGTLRIYVAAMVKDETLETEDEKTANKYIMLSASYIQ